MTLQRGDRPRVSAGASGRGPGARAARGAAALLGPWVLAAAAIGLVVLLLFVLMIIAVSGLGAGGAGGGDCSTALGGGGAGAAAAGAPGTGDAGAGAGDLSPVQRDTAAKIVSAAKGLGIGTRGQEVALATARQESGLGTAGMTVAVDHDSLGAFQQRAAWGPAGARVDVAQATRMFFEGGSGGQAGLLDIAGWERMSISEAAQAVQRSAFPGAYAKWEPMAAALVGELAGVAPIVTAGPAASPAADADAAAPVQCTPALAGEQGPGGAAGPAGPLPPGAAGQAIGFALGQQGKPYVWGAAGPDSFDCSGLMLRAFQAAGIQLPRTSREQYNAGAHVPVAQAQPGDLLFFAYDPSDPDSIHHVMLYMGGNRIVEAQQTGVPVHVRPFDMQTEKGLVPLATRPAAAQGA